MPNEYPNISRVPRQKAEAILQELQRRTPVLANEVADWVISESDLTPHEAAEVRGVTRAGLATVLHTVLGLPEGASPFTRDGVPVWFGWDLPVEFPRSALDPAAVITRERVWLWDAVTAYLVQTYRDDPEAGWRMEFEDRFADKHRARYMSAGGRFNPFGVAYAFLAWGWLEGPDRACEVMWEWLKHRDDHASIQPGEGPPPEEWPVVRLDREDDPEWEHGRWVLVVSEDAEPPVPYEVLYEPFAQWLLQLPQVSEAQCLERVAYELMFVDDAPAVREAVLAAASAHLDAARGATTTVD